MTAAEEARDLLEAADRDVRAIRGMQDGETFADEVFGFHAQQAAEKLFKAWIVCLGSEYPLTHNLIVLLGLLEELGCDVSRFWDLARYNAFAVQFRHAQFDGLEGELDRTEVTERVEDLARHVASVVAKPD